MFQVAKRAGVRGRRPKQGKHNALDGHRRRAGVGHLRLELKRLETIRDGEFDAQGSEALFTRRREFGTEVERFGRSGCLRAAQPQAQARDPARLGMREDGAETRHRS